MDTSSENRKRFELEAHEMVQAPAIKLSLIGIFLLFLTIIIAILQLQSC